MKNSKSDESSCNRLPRKVLCLQRKGENETPSKRDEIATRYLENVTLHGIGKIYQSQKVHTRFFWIMSVCVVFGLFFHQLSFLLNKLQNKNMLTQIDMRSEQGIRFPAVTFCNANRFNRDKLNELVNWKISDILDANVSLLVKLGQQPEDAFEAGTCTFGNHPCSYEKDFQMIPTYTDGNCFTFNKNGSLYQEQPGILFGLYVVLHIQQDLYDFEHLETSMHIPEGWHVSLHEPNEQPKVFYHSILAAAGQLSRMVVKKREYLRQKAPYKDNCTSDEYRLDSLDDTRYIYLTDTCLERCFVSQMYATCKALDLMNAILVKQRSNKTLPVANTTEEKDCVDTFLLNFSMKFSGCDCPPRCKDILYDVSTSTAPWPSKANLKRWVTKVNRKKSSANISEDYIRANYAAIQVYYRDFTTERAEHLPAYDWNSFLSDCGGQMGLWIGASVFSVAELMTFIIEYIFYSVCKENIPASDRILTEMNQVSSGETGQCRDKVRNVIHEDNDDNWSQI